MALAERWLGTLAVPPEMLRRGMLHLFQVPSHHLILQMRKLRHREVAYGLPKIIQGGSVIGATVLCDRKPTIKADVLSGYLCLSTWFALGLGSGFTRVMRE